MSFIVSIVGRPNVGKSTFFNRITESNEAIVEPTPGVTRDRKYGFAVWNSKNFTLIDTGGIEMDSTDNFVEEIDKQVNLSISQSDAICFMVDGREGLTDTDKWIASRLRKVNKPIFLVCNKVDTGDKEHFSFDFYSLGFGEKIYTMSAVNGYGTGEFLDDLVKLIPEESESALEDIPKIAIVGKPNVGKSTMINTLLGETRAIVSEIPGTTRDSVHSEFNAFGKKLILIDTAGLRKRSVVKEDIEFFSAIRTIKAIRQADVCMLLIDVEEGITKQDLVIFGEIAEANKGVVVLINKWDKMEKDQKSTERLTKEIKERLEPFTDVPIFFTSSITKQRILKALEKALEVYDNRNRRISTSKLNEVMLPIIEAYPPPVIKDKSVKIKFITQLPTRSPAIAFFCTNPQYVKGPYARFLENKLRENFDFTGVPVRIYFRLK